MRGEFENNLKDKLYNHEVAPSAGLFDSIVAKSNKKKGIAWWWYTAAAVLLIGGITTVYMLNRSDTSAVPESTEVIDTSINNTQESQSENIPSAIVESDNDESTTLENTAETSTESSGTSSDKVAYTPKSKFNNKTQSANPTEKGSQKFRDLFNNIVKSSPDKSGDGRMFVRDKEIPLKKGVSPDDVTPNATNNSNDQGSETKAKPETIIADKGDNKEEKFDLPEMDNTINASSNDDDKEDNADDEGGHDLPTKWAVQVIAGPGYASRYLSGIGSQIALRNEAEAYKISYGLSLIGMYQFGEAWNIQTGVDYSVRNENFDYTQESTFITSNTTTEQITVVHPVLGTIQRDVEVTTYDTAVTTAIVKSSNSYTSVSIPITVERMIPLKNSDKWLAMVNAGMLVGVHHSANGMTIAENGDAVNMNSLPYKQSGINQLSVGVGAAYTLNNTMQLMVYPQGRWALNPSLENQALKQNEFGIYTQVGLRIKF